MVKKNMFLYMLMLSLFACDRAEFGKASTDDRVTINGSVSTSDDANENNGVGSNNGVTTGRGMDLAPVNQAAVSLDFSAHDNFAYSPKSMSQILNALFLLASGSTQDELEGFEYTGLSSFTTSSFASLWIDDRVQIDNDLVNELSNIDVDVRQISLSSSDTRTHINNVARETTDGYLSELLPAFQTLDGDFLLTTGSLYTIAFQNAFNVDKTYENTFFGKTTSDRNFMVQFGTYKIVDNEDVSALAIPMENESVLILMMPKGGLEGIESLVSASFMSRLLDEMIFEDVEIHVPRMDFVNTITLSDFSNVIDVENATFTNLGEDIELGAIVHQVRFILNEQGVELDEIQNAEDPTTTLNELRFDRPFVFSIYDPATQEVELLGRMTN